MRIGIFGNTGNYPLMIAEGLRSAGHDVVLILHGRHMLHRPEARYPELQAGYPDWIIDASEFTEWDFITLKPSLWPILEELSNCDAVILNDTGPSMSALIGRPAIALLTGSDLYYYADYDTIATRTATWDPSFKFSVDGQMEISALRDFVERQREGIRTSVAVRFMPRGLVPVGDVLLDEMGVPDTKRIFIPTAELVRVKAYPPPCNKPTRLFCATRLTWAGPISSGMSELDYKGSDIMIRGIGQFWRETSTPLAIHLVRKGLHVAETEQLISEEGLTDQVTWSDEMPLAKIWEEFAHSDIVFEQLSNSIFGMACLDAMAAGRPVIGNARADVLESAGEHAPPMCQASTPEEVCLQLKRLVFDPAERERMGVAGREYVERYCAPVGAARECVNRLEEALQGVSHQRRWCGTGHSYYLSDRLASWQRLREARLELDSSRRELARLKEDLQQPGEQFTGSRVEPENTPRQPADTRSGLDGVQQELGATRAELKRSQKDFRSLPNPVLFLRRVCKTRTFGEALRSLTSRFDHSGSTPESEQ